MSRDRQKGPTTSVIVSHAYTAPNGAVIIVDGVPAEDSAQAGCQIALYTLAVAQEVQDHITAMLATGAAGVKRIAFGEPYGRDVSTRLDG